MYGIMRSIWRAQLSNDGSNRSKSIFGIGRLFVIYALLEKQSLSLLMSLIHVVLSMKSGAILASYPSGGLVQFPQAFL